MDLKSIVKNINYKGNPDDREILNIAHDSRKVKNGTLFIAISGKNNDGHNYIFEAIDKGAIAVIANGRSPITDKVPILQVKNPRKVMSKISANFYNNPSKDVNIIGITGTNGKTTTTKLIDYILNDNKKNSSSLGTLGFSTPGGIVSTGFTTPESIDLQHIIRTMADGGIRHIPMEISSHAIKLHRVENIDINIAIFTNLTIDHLDFHNTLEEYFDTKLKLFKKLNNNSLALLNQDDYYFKKIIPELKCNYETYGFNKKSDLYVASYILNINYTKINFKYKGKEYNLKTHLIGKFNIYNILSSILCSIHLGVDIKDIIKSIEKFENVPGRLEQFELTNNNHGIIDFAHSPDSFKNILSTIKELSNKKIITIFGCGGDRDRTKRPIMGAIAELYSSHVYITNDNPRNENEDFIIDEIISGFKQQNYTIIKDRYNAIENVLKNEKNKIVIILGKGREEYQIIGNKKNYYSDFESIKKYLYEN